MAVMMEILTVVSLVVCWVDEMAADWVSLWETITAVPMDAKQAV